MNSHDREARLTRAQAAIESKSLKIFDLEDAIARHQQMLIELEQARSLLEDQHAAIIAHLESEKDELQREVLALEWIRDDDLGHWFEDSPQQHDQDEDEL